jgi:hypothetical protein
MNSTFKDLPRDIWNSILEKQLDTVTLNRTQLLDLQYEIDIDSTFISDSEWCSMLNSDLYIKAKPRYPNETPITFTYAQLSCIIVNSCWEDLTWNRWNNLFDRQSNPQTAAFLSASADYTRPIVFVNRRSSTVSITTLLQSLLSGRIEVHEGTGNWDILRSQRFIDAILHGYPIPPIIVQGYPVTIIDGHSRLKAAMEFKNNLLALSDGRFYRDHSAAEKDAFDYYQIVIRLRHSIDEDEWMQLTS